MLVGVLTGESLREYHDMCKGAPLAMIQPPIIWLSAPNERLTADLSRKLASSDLEDEEGIKVRMRAVMFRNLWNQTTGMAGLYAACVCADGTTAMTLRTQLGVKDPDPDFIPNFLIAHDTMRSLKCRRYFRAFSEMCFVRSFTWQLFEAHNYNPEHETLYDNYNDMVETEMRDYVMFTRPALDSSTGVIDV